MAYFRKVLADGKECARVYFKPEKPEEPETIYWAGLKFKLLFPEGTNGRPDTSSSFQFVCLVTHDQESKKAAGTVRIGTAFKNKEDGSKTIVVYGQTKAYSRLWIGPEVFQTEPRKKAEASEGNSVNEEVKNEVEK